LTEAEFSLLVERHQDDLVRYAASTRVLDPEDVVQTSLLRLYERGAYLDKPCDPASTRAPNWLLRAVDFTARARRRDERRRAELLHDEYAEREHVGLLKVARVHRRNEDGTRREGTVATVYEDAEQLSDLVTTDTDRETGETFAEALASLDPVTVKALRLVHGEGRSWKEAALGTGLTPDALRMRVKRALPKLRERLSKLREHGCGSQEID
jgi:RNA polymerase sigma factor (sigma-70 family)